MLKRVGGLCPGLADLLRRDERIDGHHAHPQGLGLLADQTANVAESLDSELLALDLSACGRGELVAAHVDHHRDGELGDSVGVLPGSVHHDHFMGCGSGQIHIVVAGSGTHNDLQILGGVKHFLGDFVGTDDEGVHISDSRDELRSVSIFLNRREFVSRCGDNLLDPGDGRR